MLKFRPEKKTPFNKIKKQNVVLHLKYLNYRF